MTTWMRQSQDYIKAMAEKLRDCFIITGNCRNIICTLANVGGENGIKQNSWLAIFSNKTPSLLL